MDKKNKNMISEDPNYMKLGIIPMERINIKDLSLTASHDGQTAKIIHDIQQNINGINKDNLWSHLPQLSSEELAARATKAIVGPLKKIDNNSPFLSQWNKITAVNAADRLGIPQKKLQRLIAQNGPVAQRLRSMQATVSMEMEETIRRNFKLNRKSDPAFFVSVETWISKLIEEQRKILNNVAPQLSKEQKGLVIKDVLSAFIKILDFAPLQNIPADLLKNFLLLGKLGTPINVMNLQCMSFINDPTKGITVCPSADDLDVTDALGNKIRISQEDAVDKVNEFTGILKDNSIQFKLIFLVFDNDKIVLPGQEKNVELFLKSFRVFLDKRSTSEVEILRASEVISPNEFEDLWLKFNKSRENLVERIVDDEFQRLQPKTLPSSQKSREFAREVAHKLFLIQTATGATIPIIFDPLIILQRTKAQQQSSELFKIGVNTVGVRNPILIAHWKNRLVLQNPV